MKLPLSLRLMRCADYICGGLRVADIGCDHGYLSVYLLQSGKAHSVIASDIRPMPLQAAIRNAEKYGVEKNISFYLSDGVISVPRDFDVLVCAGMGADTMISILENAPWLKSTAYRLILQCQSKTPMLRRYLSENGWRIARESALKDGRFLYTVMEVIFGDPEALTPGQCYYSPALSQEDTQEASAYYFQVLKRLKRAVTAQGENADPYLISALSELTEKEKEYGNR